MATYSSIRYNFPVATATTSAQVGAGAMTLIKSIDSDGSDATISFVDGASSVVLDNTYKNYLFKFISVHSEEDDRNFQFNGRDGGSDYDATKTTTVFSCFHKEGAGGTTEELAYQSGQDSAQQTGFQNLNFRSSNDNDAGISGWLWLSNPSSTTYTTHFMAVQNNHETTDVASMVFYTAGYFNVTAAIDAMQFKFSSGEIQGGTINLYGIK
jgi:hypothetical protein